MSSDKVDERLDRLEAGLEAMQRRIGAIEERSGYGEAEPAPAYEAAEPVAPEVSAESWLSERFGTTPAGVATLFGRTLLVLAGAYLLRAVTDAGFVLRTVGAALGLAYAASWLLLAIFDARRERHGGAVFHGLASSLIAYPLIWETTTRFDLLSPVAAAVLLATFFVAGLLVAIRWHLPESAWVATVFALGTAAVLFVGTKHLLPFTVSLLVIAAVTEATSFTDRWINVRWPVALTLDLAGLTIAFLMSREAGLPDSYPELTARAAMALLVALPIVYLVSFAARNLGRRIPAGPFEVLQSVAMLAIGLGGAASISFAGGSNAALIGFVACAIGIGSYGATFAFADRRRGHERNFYFFSTMGGVLLLAGTSLFVEGVPRAVTWAVIALLIVWAGRRYDRFTLRMHGALYVAAACWAAGLVSGAAARLFGPGAAAAWDAWPLGGLAVFAIVGVVYVMLVDRAREGMDVRPVLLLPRAIAAAAIAWCAAGLVSGAVVGAAALTDGAWIAAVRTGTLALSAIALAVAGRGGGHREFIWLAYPVLVLGAAKLLLEDLRVGTPLSLFTSFALYGLALVVAPRLIRRRT